MRNKRELLIVTIPADAYRVVKDQAAYLGMPFQEYVEEALWQYSRNVALIALQLKGKR